MLVVFFFVTEGGGGYLGWTEIQMEEGWTEVQMEEGLRLESSVTRLSFYEGSGSVQAWLKFNSNCLFLSW